MQTRVELKMKNKRILIIFMNNGSMESIVEKEFMWKTITGKYGEAVKTIETQNKRVKEFADGTVVELLTANNIRGKRFTEVYVAKSMLSKELVYVISMGLMEFENNSRNNIMEFSFNRENGIEITEYKGGV
jgi:hypothetical protein